MNLLRWWDQRPQQPVIAVPGGGGRAGGLILAGLAPKPTSNGFRDQAARALAERRNRDFERNSKRLRAKIRQVLKIHVEPYQVVRRGDLAVVAIDGLTFCLYDPGSYSYLQVELLDAGTRRWFDFYDMAALGKHLEEHRAP